jgi:hypothetical protein
MRSVRKSIRRATKESAVKSMNNHIEKMTSKGWKIDQEFVGASGCSYTYTTYFYK